MCKGHCQRTKLRVYPGGVQNNCIQCEVMLAMYNMLCIVTVYLISEKKLSMMASSMAEDEDEFVTLLVNNLSVTGRKNIKAKTMLCHYCQ